MTFDTKYFLKSHQIYHLSCLSLRMPYSFNASRFYKCLARIKCLHFNSFGLDSVVDNALACHHGDPGSNPGQGMWQGSGRPSRFGGFPPGSPVSSTTFDHLTPTPAPSRTRI